MWTDEYFKMVDTGILRQAVEMPAESLPSYTAGEVAICHGLLDEQGVPREVDGSVLRLDERVGLFIKVTNDGILETRDQIKDMTDEIELLAGM